MYCSKHPIQFCIIFFKRENKLLFSKKLFIMKLLPIIKQFESLV